jgi:cytochrome P450
MVEAVSSLTMLMRQLRFEFAGDQVPVPIHQITLRPQGGMPMQIRRRQPP